MKLRAYIQKFKHISKFLLTILIAPLAIDLINEYLINNGKSDPLPTWKWVLTIITVLLFFMLIISSYTDWFDSLIISINNAMRKRRLRKPRFLILDGTIGIGVYETPPIPVQTDLLPSDWESALKDQSPNCKIEIGSIRKFTKSQKFQVVINPFGEEYPEEEVNSYLTFSQICNFVYSGGIWVNVAGIPFWYCHDSRNPEFSKKMVTAGFLQKISTEHEDIVINRPLFTTIFYQLSYSPGDPIIVDCVQSDSENKKFGDLVNAGGTNRAKMFRAYAPRIPGVIPLLRCENPDMWIICSLKYGDGYFLIAGMDLRGDDHTSFEKIIAAIKGWIHYEINK